MLSAASCLSPSAPPGRHHDVPGTAGEGAGRWFLPAVVAAHAARIGGRTAYGFISGDSVTRTLSFAALDGEVRRVAALVEAQTAPGDRVGLTFLPGIDFVVAFLGVLAAGRVAVPAVPPASRTSAERFRTILSDADCAAVLTSRPTLAATPDLRLADLPATFLAIEDAASGPAPVVEVATVPDSPALLQYTSGSTAEPKGVILTHRNLAAAAAAIDGSFRAGERDVGLSWLPLEHDMGLVGGALHLLWHGGTLLLMSPAAFVRRPLGWLEAIGRHRVTISGGPNSAYERCLDALGSRSPPAGLDLSSWCIAFNGAEPVAASTLDRFAAAFAPAGFRHSAFLPCYGLAEATLLVAGAGRDAGPRIVAPLAGRPFVSCGRPRTTGGVVVADPQTREAIADGREGEIWIAGDSVAAGYWRRPEASRETFGVRLADGRGPFLRSGDLGLLSGGELVVTGRLKDTVIAGGRTLHPEDLERTVAGAHPALRQGRAVVVQPDEAGAAEAIAEIALGRLGADSLPAVARAIWRALLREEGLAAGRVVLVRAGSLLWTTSGKIRRRDTRAALGRDRSRILLDWSPEADGVGPEAPGRLAAVAALAARRDALTPTDLGAFVAAWAGAVLGVPPEAIEPDVSFADLGLSSLLATEFVLDVEAATGRELPLALLFEAPTPGRLVAHLAALP